MNKINGYTEEEAKSLVQYVCDGLNAGKNLSGIFVDFVFKLFSGVVFNRNRKPALAHKPFNTLGLFCKHVAVRIKIKEFRRPIVCGTLYLGEILFRCENLKQQLRALTKIRLP